MLVGVLPRVLPVLQLYVAQGATDQMCRMGMYFLRQPRSEPDSSPHALGFPQRDRLTPQNTLRTSEGHRKGLHALFLSVRIITSENMSFKESSTHFIPNFT